MNKAQPKSNRRGLTFIELIAACAVMVVVMSFVTTLCFQISNVWKDIGYQRVALAELSNQLDRLTRLNGEELESEIQVLEPSELAGRSLREPTITGDLVQTELGTQIRLRLNWTRQDSGKAVELSAWVQDDAQTAGGSDGKK